MTGTAVGTMRALAKTAPAPGAELVERPVPSPGGGEVLLKMEAASICGTDHHLFTWDDWAAENLVQHVRVHTSGTVRSRPVVVLLRDALIAVLEECSG